jgi:hypothetical protein
VKLGKKGDWERAIKNIPEKSRKKFPGLYFFIDSTEFAMQNKGEGEGPNWIYKCNSRRKYMLMFDERGRARKMWGGYSPKVYDGHFLQLMKRWFEKKAQRAGVMGDQHLEWGKNLIPAHQQQRCKNNTTTQQDKLRASQRS